MTIVSTLGRKARKISLAALTPFLVFGQASAQVENEMNDFFDKINTQANITGPSSANGQQAGYYTLGNVFIRNKVETIQPVSVQLPSVRAGCNGIDIFAGGFSFVNSEQLVAFMKAVANNAASFAFQVALESISPVIAETVGSLQSKADAINRFNMNSCAEAQALVGSVWPASDAASKVICESEGVKNGLFSDWADARHSCGSEGQTTATNMGASPEAKAQLPEKNIAWEALKQLEVDQSYREFLMTMTGTAILLPAADDDSSREWKRIPAQFTDEGTLTTLMNGGEMMIWKCDEPELCLNPTQSTENVSVNNGLVAKVRANILSILGKIESRQALEDDEKAFLNLTTLPMYKILSVHHAYAGVFAESVASYSEIVAVDILFALTNEFAKDINSSSSTAVAGLDEEVEKWRDNIVNQRALLYSYQAQLQNKLMSVQQIVAATQGLERQLAGRLSRDVADAYEFTKASTF